MLQNDTTWGSIGGRLPAAIPIYATLSRLGLILLARPRVRDWFVVFILTCVNFWLNEQWRRWWQCDDMCSVGMYQHILNWSCDPFSVYAIHRRHILFSHILYVNTVYSWHKVHQECPSMKYVCMYICNMYICTYILCFRQLGPLYPQCLVEDDMLPRKQPEPESHHAPLDIGSRLLPLPTGMWLRFSSSPMLFCILFFMCQNAVVA